MDYSTMPITDLMEEIHENRLSLKDPSISHRLREIASYNNGSYCIPLLMRLCGEHLLKIEDIILLLENGADPNTCCVVLSVGEAIWTTRPLNNFIWAHSIETEEEKEVLRALLDYGMEPNLCSSEYDLGGRYSWLEHVQERFRRVQEFHKNYLAEQEELLCKEPDN